MFKSIILVVVMLLGGLTTTQVSGKELVAEEKFVDGVAQSIIELMKDKNAPRSQLEDGFRKVLRNNFNLDSIARFVLGKHRKTATEAELAEFRQLFEDSIVKSYVSQFKDYAGETLSVLKSGSGSDGGVVVYSQVNRPKPIDVNWFVRNGKVHDVIVNGVSMSVTQRSEYASIINREGNGVAGLNRALSKNIKQQS